MQQIYSHATYVHTYYMQVSMLLRQKICTQFINLINNTIRIISL